MVMAERGAGGQQHLEEAKERLLEMEGAGIGVKWRMLHTIELLVSKERMSTRMASARAKDVWSCGARPSMISWGGAAGASVVAAAADDDKRGGAAHSHRE